MTGKNPLKRSGNNLPYALMKNLNPPDEDIHKLLISTTPFLKFLFLAKFTRSLIIRDDC